MKVIPHSLFEKIVDQGLLDIEFPAEKLSPIDLVVNKLPSTLQETAKLILTQLTKSEQFKWNSKNEISYKGSTFLGSDIVNLISDLVHGSKKLLNLYGVNIFIKALKDENVPSHLYNIVEEEKTDGQEGGHFSESSIWIRFEDKFNLIEK